MQVRKDEECEIAEVSSNRKSDLRQRFFCVILIDTVGVILKGGGKRVSSFTKKAILESFLRLVSKKNFDKITVRDIVDECGVNRNTFYYYFQDIYALLEEIAGEMLCRLPGDAGSCDTLSQFFSTMCDFAAAYPRAAKGLALSFGFEGLERYFLPRLEHAVCRCLAREGRPDTAARQDLARLLCHATLGACLTMMRADGGRLDRAAEKQRFWVAIQALTAPFDRPLRPESDPNT